MVTFPQGCCRAEICGLHAGSVIIILQDCHLKIKFQNASAFRPDVRAHEHRDEPVTDDVTNTASKDHSGTSVLLHVTDTFLLFGIEACGDRQLPLHYGCFLATDALRNEYGMHPDQHLKGFLQAGGHLMQREAKQDPSR